MELSGFIEMVDSDRYPAFGLMAAGRFCPFANVSVLSFAFLLVFRSSLGIRRHSSVFLLGVGRGSVLGVSGFGVLGFGVLPLPSCLFLPWVLGSSSGVALLGLSVGSCSFTGYFSGKLIRLKESMIGWYKN